MIYDQGGRILKPYGTRVLNYNTSDGDFEIPVHGEDGFFVCCTEDCTLTVMAYDDAPKATNAIRCITPVVDNTNARLIHCIAGQVYLVLLAKIYEVGSDADIDIDILY